jgi:hypothetical protein
MELLRERFGHFWRSAQTDYEALWQRLKSEIQKQSPTGRNPNEFFVDTVLKPVGNRIQIYDDRFMRLSEKSDTPQIITKDDVIYFAAQAVGSGNHE